MAIASNHRPQIRVGDAARAMKALLANPEDTAQVFRIIEALSGRNGLRTLSRFRKTRTGATLLRARPQLLKTLIDRESLSKLPDGTLGREYLRFLDAEGITAEGLTKASVEGRTRDPKDLPADLDFLRNRMRDSHDLWHVVTGYKGDLIGEASLLAFSFAQTRNPGVGVIVGMALLRGREPSVRRLILSGFVRGLRATWLPVVEWERLLALPLDEVRQQLRVGEPPVYQTFRAPSYMRAAAA
jgi:ubiquinone biosynthesis protein COQ4